MILSSVFNPKRCLADQRSHHSPNMKSTCVAFGHLLLLTVCLISASGAVNAGYPISPDDIYVHRRRLSGHPHLHWDHVVRRATAAPSPSPPVIPRSTTSRVFHVTSYGADPTGATDSTAAISKAIADAFAASSGDTLTPGITDLGGAEVHLHGGVYLISKPLSLPSSGGNFKLHSGSLRASNDFPTGRYLIELWSSPSAKATPDDFSLSSTASYAYEYITLRDLALDANYIAGGIAVVDSLRTTIDNCYIIHFASDGIWVRGGHETYIRGGYIGQHITAGGDPGERNFSGTGIVLNGNDNAVTDVVIFSAAVGVMVSGQANTLSGVHCYNKASGFGGVGIYVKLPGLTQTRIVNCYLDYTGIVAEDPNQLHVSSSFFLGSANVVIKSVKGSVKGVEIFGNMFAGAGGDVRDIVVLDESAGRFTVLELRVEKPKKTRCTSGLDRVPEFQHTDVDQVYVRDNAVEGMRVRSTAAAAAVEASGSEWEADFSSVLLFPNRIAHVQCTFVYGGSGFPNHAVRNVSENRVVVRSDVPVSATVHVAVDQSTVSLA